MCAHTVLGTSSDLPSSCVPAGLQLSVDFNELHALVSQQAGCCPDVWIDCAGVHGRDAAAACSIVGSILLLLLLLQLLLLFYVSVVLHRIPEHLVRLEALCIHRRGLPVLLLLLLWEEAAARCQLLQGWDQAGEVYRSILDPARERNQHRAASLNVR